MLKSLPLDTMRQLLFLSLTAAISAIQAPMEAYAVEQETQNVDPSFAILLRQDIAGMLYNHKQELDTKLSNLENICTESSNANPDFELLPEQWESKMEQLVEKFVDQLLRFSKGAIETVEKQMNESLDTTLSQIDLKLVNVRGDIDSLKTQMSELVTQEEVANLQGKLIGLAVDSVDAITSELLNFTTSGNTNNQQLEEQLSQILEQVENVTKCGNSDTEKLVLDHLQKSDRRLQELSEILQNSNSETQQCSSTCNGFTEKLGGLKETMQGNMNAMSGLNVSMETMKNSFAIRLEELENAALNINELIQTKIESARPEITTTAATPVSVPFNHANPPACLDSNFLGAGRSLNVCNAAVRFRKCHLTFVAIHCCRSCRDAGLISSVPIFSGSRDVPVLQALKSIRPV